MAVREKLRRELITQTARVWTRLSKELEKDLKEISEKWINGLCKEKFPEKFTNKLKSALREALAYGYWLQWLYLYKRSGKKYQGKITLAEGDSVKESVQKFITTGEWNEVIPESAVNWINGYVPILSGVFNHDVLAKTRDIIKNSLLEGTTHQEREKELQKVFDFSQTRIEAIARTEITRAHNLGSLLSMKANPDVIGFEFSAVLDNRTTEICQHRHGLLMRLDDPRLAENTPPLHVRCRSMLLSVTIYDNPDGLLTSHEFDEVLPSEQRVEDIKEVQKIFEREASKKSSKKSSKNSSEQGTSKVEVNRKTIKELQQLAVDLGITRNADFTGLDKRAVTELIQGIKQARDIFPGLPVMDFIGSCQALYNFIWDLDTRKKFQKNPNYWRRRYPDKTDETIIRIIKYTTPYKKTKLADTILALSSSQQHAKGISLNKNRFSSKSISVTLNDLVYNEKIKYTPIGCTTIKSIIDHEMGHQIDDLILARKDTKIIKLFEKLQKNKEMENALSGYAGEGNYIEEFIAESWAEYQNNPKCRETAKTVAERMIEIYKGQFKK